MTTKLIIECGATKSQLRVLDGREGVNDATGRGINFATMPFASCMENCFSLIDSVSSPFEEVHLYAAGVTDKCLSDNISKAVLEKCQCARVEIQSDLMASARALCGHKAGIAVIMGTGSNSCQYDGEKIVAHVNTGGFILGDEGSAASLGRIFISDYIKGFVPQELALQAERQFKLSYASIVEAVYRAPAPSAFLGSLAPFILSKYSHPYMKKLVDDNFNSFIDRVLKQYDRLPVGIVGGFAFACSDILTPLFKRAGIELSRITRYPMDGLADFHMIN